MDGLAAVQARIQEIENQFRGGGIAGGRLGADATSDTSDPTSFADALSQAQSTSTATGAGATPDTSTSSGALNRAGVDSTQWARDFLTKIGMPITTENVRAMTAWQQAEGTAAHFNPLATTQSGYAGETRFNSVGVKNYVTYQDGINANAHAIQNGRYGNILAALRAGNNADSVADAIANSPWGTGGLVRKILDRQG